MNRCVPAFVRTTARAAAYDGAWVRARARAHSTHPACGTDDVYDVVIVGGGLVGAALACALTRVASSTSSTSLLPRVALIDESTLPPLHHHAPFANRVYSVTPASAAFLQESAATLPCMSGTPSVTVPSISSRPMPLPNQSRIQTEAMPVEDDHEGSFFDHFQLNDDNDDANEIKVLHRESRHTKTPPLSKHQPKAPRPQTIKEHAVPRPPYVIDGQLQRVPPYMYVYESSTKSRWVGRTLIDVFTDEFMLGTSDYYIRAIGAGKILVSDQLVHPEYRLKDLEKISHYVHRHEPPVLSQPLVIAHETEDLLVIDKPSSLPVHPTGRYTYNSVVEILRSPRFGYRELYPINRLDRLTSGLCFVAKTLAKSQTMSKDLQSRIITKQYLTRVRGEFPEEELDCHQPILNVSQKMTLNIVHPSGKPCHTKFKRLSFNGLTSVVLCTPTTGRTHQIRVHLQYLGHPIANDPIYSASYAFGPDSGRGGLSMDELKAALRSMTSSLPVNPLHSRMDVEPERVGGVSANCSYGIKNNAVSACDASVVASADKYESAPWECADCVVKRADPLPEQLCIWLHAWKYELRSSTYHTDIPEWARDDFGGDQILPDRFWKYGGRWDGRAAGEYEPLV
ncbi:hypothetical protein SeMB42_g05149 [Synchytrium endobioticum]|uniref:Pseudouridine synthase RsuA/RluA-like domain-containing protein n=1 Tax=Synchytrium endobioticum TaxID=286115 RepID=A0A507CT84_9FUNG|nr:hypothetical protein SeMB42_g05149 [Synchytrium endobioticum]